MTNDILITLIVGALIGSLIPEFAKYVVIWIIQTWVFCVNRRKIRNFAIGYIDYHIRMKIKRGFNWEDELARIILDRYNVRRRDVIKLIDKIPHRKDALKRYIEHWLMTRRQNRPQLRVFRYKIRILKSGRLSRPNRG